MDLSSIFPPEISLVVADDEMWQTPLRDEEERIIEGAIDKRCREFRAGRHAAHRALARLQAPDIPILRGERREPLWPNGFVGSIAHCRGLCIAASAVDSEIAGIGLDVEPLIPLPQGTDRYIHTQSDEFLMRESDQSLPERLIFSAKESLYKCYYPLLESFFGFQSVSLIDVEDGAFRFKPTDRCEVEFPSDLVFHGRYLSDASHLVTACYLTRK
jgi:4'-phosphopantetheinyl transferase EntD